MVDISRVRVAVGGAAITGPGVSTFYTSGSGASLQAALKTFYTSISNVFPTSLNFSFPSGGETIDSETGEFVSAWSGATASTVVGTATVAGFIAGTGARIVWATNGVTNGRRVRGSTFLVPLGASMFGLDGNIQSAIVTDLETKINTFRTSVSPGFGIWRRPLPESPEHPSGVAGGFNSVTGSSLSPRTTWLITRRT